MSIPLEIDENSTESSGHGLESLLCPRKHLPGLAVLFAYVMTIRLGDVVLN